MPLTLPLDLIAEYRGQAPGGTFEDRKTGEAVDYGARLKFEYEDERGDVALVPIRIADLDKCEPKFDASTLQKGDVVRLQGRVVLADRGSGKDSYMAVASCSIYNEAAVPLKAAS